MALLVDSQEATNLGHRAAAASTLSWTFTNTAGNLIVVGVVATDASIATSITSVTYNGVAMTAGPTVAYDGTKTTVGLFSLVTPATGANTILVTSGGLYTATLAGAISFSGANTASPIGTTSTNSSGTTVTHATAGSITAASGNYVLGVGGWGSGTAGTVDASQTKTFALVGAGDTGGDDIFAGYQQSAGSAINLGFTWSPADVFGMVAAEIKAAGGTNASSQSPSTYLRANSHSLVAVSSPSFPHVDVAVGV